MANDNEKLPVGIKFIKGLREKVATRQAELSGKAKPKTGLPDFTTPTPGSDFSYAAPVMSEQIKTAQETSKNLGVTGLKQTYGLPEPGSNLPVKTPTEISPTTTEQTTVTEPKQPEVGGGFKPYTGTPEERQKEIQGLAEAGHVFTNEDLKKYYGTRGLPEAGQNLKGYYASQIESLSDRAAKISDEIAAGFREGNRSSSVEELKALHLMIAAFQAAHAEESGIPSKVKLSEAQAGEATAKAGKEKKETELLAPTHEKAFAEAKELAGIKAVGEVRDFTKEAFDKKIMDIDTDQYMEDEMKEQFKKRLYSQFPQYASMTGVNTTDTGMVEVDGVKYKQVNGRWQREKR
jgi:hypothetical protein